jgi:phosphoribosylformylglycinamidine synthase
VQVGNPFLEKCLMEACLELVGDPRVVAVQDLGAAGLTSSAAELAWRGGCGIDLDVARVARRERGMTPYEVMLSESQERMLIVVHRGQEEGVRAAFARWDLRSDVVGTITDDARMRVRDGGEVVADLPLRMIVDEVPLRHPEGRRPGGIDALLARDPLPGGPPWPHGEALLRLLASPNLGSRRPVFRRSDHQVGDDTVVPPGGDAAVLRIRGTSLGLALTTDGNARYGVLDPRRGAAIAVCEAARNLVATGAEPLAVTNCLNFGNPEKPEVFWQLAEAVEGIAEACEALGVPVVSGNVSLYNDTSGVSIDPTPVIGMVGRLADVTRRLTPAFAAEGDEVSLVGPVEATLGASEYQRLATGEQAGPPPDLDLDLERRVQAAVLEAAAAGLLASAHDCAEGGLAVALAECCLGGGLGARCSLEEVGAGRGLGSEGVAILFGEGQSRFLVSHSTEVAVQFRALMDRHRVPLRRLGVVGGGRVRIEPVLDVSLGEAGAAHEEALL